jgi:hypothetical protein
MLRNVESLKNILFQRKSLMKENEKKNPVNKNQG